jgi:hypothetical protein
VHCPYGQDGVCGEGDVCREGATCQFSRDLRGTIVNRVCCIDKPVKGMVTYTNLYMD